MIFITTPKNESDSESSTTDETMATALVFVVLCAVLAVCMAVVFLVRKRANMPDYTVVPRKRASDTLNTAVTDFGPVYVRDSRRISGTAYKEWLMAFEHANITACVGFFHTEIVYARTLGQHAIHALVHESTRMHAIRDIARGMRYLHACAYQDGACTIQHVHGALTLDAVVWDGRTARVTDWHSPPGEHAWRNWPNTGFPDQDSDVWDFAWVVWQIYHPGAAPTGKSDKRLQPEAHADLVALVDAMWDNEPGARPVFAAICDALDAIRV